MEHTVTESGRHIPHLRAKRVSGIGKWPGLTHLLPTVAWESTLKRRDDRKFPGSCTNKAFSYRAPDYPQNTALAIDANKKFVDVVVDQAVQLPGNHPWYSLPLAALTLIDY